MARVGRPHPGGAVGGNIAPTIGANGGLRDGWHPACTPGSERLAPMELPAMSQGADR